MSLVIQREVDPIVNTTVDFGTTEKVSKLSYQGEKT